VAYTTDMNDAPPDDSFDREAAVTVVRTENALLRIQSRLANEACSRVLLPFAAPRPDEPLGLKDRKSADDPRVGHRCREVDPRIGRDPVLAKVTMWGYPIVFLLS
jgi:hypothetical protein